YPSWVGIWSAPGFNEKRSRFQPTWDSNMERSGSEVESPDRDHALDRDSRLFVDLIRNAYLELHVTQAVAQLRHRDHLHVLSEGHRMGLDLVGLRGCLLQRVEHPVLGRDDVGALRVFLDMLEHPPG